MKNTPQQVNDLRPFISNSFWRTELNCGAHVHTMFQQRLEAMLPLYVVYLYPTTVLSEIRVSLIFRCCRNHNFCISKVILPRTRIRTCNFCTSLDPDHLFGPDETLTFQYTSRLMDYYGRVAHGNKHGVAFQWALHVLTNVS